MSTCRTTRPPE